MKYFSKYILPAIAVSLFGLFVTGCSTHKKATKKNHYHKEQTQTVKQIEREAEKGLRGDEKKIVEEAFEWIGTPYVYGRQDKGVATDCSGLVMMVFDKAIGCNLPRNSAKQAEFCDHISQKKVKAGDLVFFITNSGNKINHVGIMIDEVQFIHASSKGVVVASIESNYYKTHLQKFGRVPCMKH